MGDWPNDIAPANPAGIIASYGYGSVYADVALVQGTVFNGTTAAVNGSSTALFMPIIVPVPITVYQLGWLNSTVVSGNVDIGIYDITKARIVSAGSTAQAGTSTSQAVDVTDTPLAAGLYYLALVQDNTTGVVTFAGGGSVQIMRSTGMQEMASAFPLPTTATFATPSHQWVPACFATFEGATF